MEHEKNRPVPAKPTIATPAEWLRARKELLVQEKELTRRRDEVARLRRSLPWVRVAKEYRFDGPDGVVALGDLFRGRSQLIVYHFMFGPDWKEGCPSCSFVGDHLDGARLHLEQRDVAFAAVSRAPWPKLAAFRERLGWRFPWFSSHGRDFNFDFCVSASEADKQSGEMVYNFERGPVTITELPGLSVFARDAAGAIHHTYSTYARGLDPLLGTYQLLDLVPKGRDEEGLPFPMSWVRHHDRYGPAHADPWPAIFQPIPAPA